MADFEKGNILENFYCLHCRVKGISLLLDGEGADGGISRYFRNKSMTFKMLQEEIAKEQQIFLTFGNEHLSSVFLEIAENPFYYENEYLLLKALELIWLSSHCIKKDKKEQA
ncbi:hypothetical protein [Clostridium sp. HBUAS56010]|uniref:hypothetical protein n=1 Tax=Clostridium sp. HBUAS56010 TaxID=2571127 RepID=UPI001177719A|nr:hypothetical protein [Clostridium sp. HBUAS56010]